MLTLEKLVAATTLMLVVVIPSHSLIHVWINFNRRNIGTSCEYRRYSKWVNSSVRNDNFRVDVIIKDLNSIWKFQAKIEPKCGKLEEVIFTGKSKNDIENVNDNAHFVVSLPKSKITLFKSELSKEVGIIQPPSDQLVLCSDRKS